MIPHPKWIFFGLRNPKTEKALILMVISNVNWMWRYIIIELESMCQFLCCGCWWFNCVGVPCGGCHNAYCLCSYWICKPVDLTNIDPDCCHVCAFDGWGYNCLFWGNIFCAPDAVKEWSRIRTSGGDGGQQVVIINNNYTPWSQ